MRLIEKTLFQFIWKYSKRDQLILLMFTITLFPLLFLTLELPKRIINDAIGARSSNIDVFGASVDQVTFLGVLCVGFLLAVLMHGILKMRINTMKGVLSERMLRRLRFGLIERMLRFPKPYFQRTSQGELVAMITGETEPMGGMMGEALTQPVLQAGQMITILAFLFLQSVWFGLAAIALIPLQAWIIPKLQRQINLMNKERIKEVRNLAAVIGESAAGASELRAHGGWRHRLAMVTDKLGVVFEIRLLIYKKKFFMKFLNNFITQLTPFFFFSVGGYLVIQGSVSLGALVAALAAYKDLSSPWKELLTYYNQAQDMSLRWETVVEKFSPTGVIDEALMSRDGVTDISISGPLELQNVTVLDADGNTVLDNISGRFPPGSVVAVTARSEEDRRALANVLTREVVPVEGQVLFGGHDLKTLHQTVIAAKIGHANSRPVLFKGSFGDNVMMPLKAQPVREAEADHAAKNEALAAGNSPDALNIGWLNPEQAGLQTQAELRAWWLTLITAIGSNGPLFRRALDQPIRHGLTDELASGLIVARPKVWSAIEAADLAKHVHRFDPERYNPALPLASNLFFATPKATMTQAALSEQTSLFALLRKLGLEAGLLELSRDVVDLLNQIFGTDGTEHPLFRKLGLDPVLFERSVKIVRSLTAKTPTILSDADIAILMTVPTQISAEQIGPAFSVEIQDRILELRTQKALHSSDELNELYVPFDLGAIAPGLSVLENAVYGKISDSAGSRADELRKIVSDVLDAEGLKPKVIELIYDLELSLNGTNLPSIYAEPLAISRAAIKRPDVLILEQTLASYEDEMRVAMHRNLRKLMPQTTLIYLADRFENPERFDVHIEIEQGRMISADPQKEAFEDTAASADLQRKVRALETTDMFSGLSRKQLRLLAFGAKWYHASAGEVIFQKDDDPKDGAYMLLSGTAVLFQPEEGGEDHVITTVGQGVLVGELGLIRNVPRALSMRAETDLMALRLGAEEFLAVVENDAATSFKLLQVVAGYTS